MTVEQAEARRKEGENPVEQFKKRIIDAVHPVFGFGDLLEKERDTRRNETSLSTVKISPDTFSLKYRNDGEKDPSHGFFLTVGFRKEGKGFMRPSEKRMLWEENFSLDVWRERHRSKIRWERDGVEVKFTDLVEVGEEVAVKDISFWDRGGNGEATITIGVPPEMIVGYRGKSDEGLMYRYGAIVRFGDILPSVGWARPGEGETVEELLGRQVEDACIELKRWQGFCTGLLPNGLETVSFLEKVASRAKTQLEQCWGEIQANFLSQG